MTTPRMQALIEEYGLEIDDIRWYLCVQKTNDLMGYQTRQWELIHEIWSGNLADSLYQMEERWLETNEGLLNSGQREEAKVRDMLAECRASKRRRRLRAAPGSHPSQDFD